ncbi:DUF6193 family natural product biosynthesis protein [Hamadaea tsunoensis]|uniref:DUF6193 family natural product biosynthesis protein n=1 Tax=Hamadaea tsunoensis TaxID=53368 RepID=UPI000687C7B9|nr:DUF6193 family natural product biosynthesis protein [Hamadaea tsunoensis]
MQTEPDQPAAYPSVSDDDRARRIAARWDYERKDARDSGRAGQAELIEAAYARPELRRLCPYTSHWALRFATVPLPERPGVAEGEVSVNTVSVFVTSAGRYAVKEDFWGPVVAEFATAAEAVAATIRLAEAGGPDVRHSGSSTSAP